MEEQFAEYKNNALVFGRSNRNQNGEYLNIGESGNAIKTGAGLTHINRPAYYYVVVIKQN